MFLGELPHFLNSLLYTTEMKIPMEQCRFGGYFEICNITCNKNQCPLSKYHLLTLFLRKTKIFNNFKLDYALSVFAINLFIMSNSPLSARRTSPIILIRPVQNEAKKGATLNMQYQNIYQHTCLHVFQSVTQLFQLFLNSRKLIE